MATQKKEFDYRKRLQDGLEAIITTAQHGEEKKVLKYYKNIIRMAKAQLKNLEAMGGGESDES